MGWARKELGIELNPFRVAESALNKIGNTITAIMNNPIPAILQVAGAMIGIPPYVTAAAVTAVQGGDFEDIAKAVAVSYVTTEFLQNTQIGADIRNYTSNLIAGDVTDYMIENFDISMDQAVTVAKMTTAAVNGAVVGGIRSTLLGDSIATGMAQGFSQGLVYSGVDSYFDDLNKDPNWGLGPKTLNLVKGATSTALNTLISGKGDPGAAIGNYLAYATLKIGASEAKTAFQRAYDEYTGKTDEARNAQAAFVNTRAEYDSEVRRHDMIADEIRQQAAAHNDILTNQLAPIRAQLEKEQAEVEMQQIFQKDALKTFEDNKWAYENYDAKLKQLGYQLVSVPSSEGGGNYDTYWVKQTGTQMVPQSYNDGDYTTVSMVEVPIIDYNVSPPSQESFAVAANAAGAQANNHYTLAQQAADRYKAVAQSEQTNNLLVQLEAIKTEIGQKTATLSTIRQNIETPKDGNLAERLKVAAERYDNKYNLYKSSEEATKRAAENYNRIMAEVVVRDATIDAINEGAITVTGRNADGSFTLDNGFTVKDGKFFQNNEQLFTNAAGLSQNVLELATPDGQVTRYGMDAGRQLSTTDVQNIFKRDYGLNVSLDEARRFAGSAFDKVENAKLQDFAIDKISQEFKSITNKDLSAAQAKELLVQQDSVKAAQERAIIESNLYVPSGEAQDRIAFAKAAAEAQRQGKDRFSFTRSDGQVEDHFIETNAQRAAAQERAVIETALTEQVAGSTIQPQNSFRESAARELLESYKNQGLSPQEIDQKLSSGQAAKDLNEVLNVKQQQIEQQKTNVESAEKEFGRNSAEAKDAYREVVENMADYGGYGYEKNEDGTISHKDLGKLDPETLVPVDRSKSWTDPVTGKLHIEITGVGSDEKIPAKDVSALWGIGKSGNPPTIGGEAIFGDGSGVSPGSPGLTLIAVDDGSGDANAKMFDVGNGFALIAYSDGRTKLVKNDGTVFFVDTEDAKKAMEKMPVVTAPTIAIDGGKKEETPLEKGLGEFYKVLTDPQLADKLYPKTPEQPTVPAPVTPTPVTPPGTPEAPVTPPVTPETPVTPPVTPETPVTPPVTPVTPPVTPETPVTSPVTPSNEVEQLRQQLTQQIQAAQATGKADVEAVQQAVNTVAANLGTTKEELLQRLGTSETQLRTDITSQVGGVENRLTQAINQAKQSGLDGDAALQAAITKVSGDLGTTKTDLLSQLRKTEEQLRADVASQVSGVQTQIGGVESRLSEAITQAKAAGMQGDQALQSAIDKVAGDVGTTKADLLGQLGKTEQQLRSDFASQLGGVQAQIGNVESRLTDAIAQARSAGLEGDQALQVAINKVSSDVGLTKTDLLAQLGKTEQQLRSDLSSQIGGVESRLTDAIAQARQSGMAGDAALQASIDKVAAEAGLTKEQLLTQLGKTEAQLRQDVGAQIGGVESRLTEAIAQARQSGLDGEAALQIGLNKVASDLNITKDLVLEQVGKTESQLRTDFAEQLGGVQLQIEKVQSDLNKAIADAKSAGASDVEAVRNAVNQVATDLGTNSTALLYQLGTTETQLRSEMRSGQEATQEQIRELGSVFMQQYDALSAAQKQQFDALVEQGANMQTAMNTIQADIQSELQNVESRLTSAVAANEAAGLSRDQALTKAIGDVAANVGLTKEDLLSRMGQSEAALREQFAAGQTQTQQQIANLDASTQAKFAQMSEAQKAQALQLAQTSGDLTAAINNVAATTTAQIGNVETRLKEAMAANEAAGLSRDQAAAKAIDDVAASVGSTKADLLSQLGKTEETIRGELAAGLAGVQTGLEQQLAGVQSRLNEAIAANEAAGLSRDQAIAKSIQDVASNLGVTKDALLAQMGTTEQTLRGELAAGLQATQQQLSQQMQAQYQQLTEAQKAEVDARVRQGQDLTAAITAVGAQTASQIAQTEAALRESIQQLGTDVQGQFNQMSESQKAEVAARVQQGQDLNAAIQNVSQQTSQQIAASEASLQAAIGQLGTNVQQQFSQMDAAQKAEVVARVQQGQDLQSAITNVGSEMAQRIAESEQGLRTAIGQLGADVQGRFDQMSDAQKAEVAARVQQGQDLRGAIDNVGQQTTQQIAASEAAMRQAIGQLGTDVQTQFGQMSAAQQAEVAARVQQGQDLSAAIQNVGQQTTQQIAASETALKGQISSLGEDMQKQFNAMNESQQTQFNSMNEAQQAEVAARVQQGETLDSAIKTVGLQVTELGEKLTTDVQDIRKTMEEENKRKQAADRASAAKTQQEQLLQKAQQNIAVPGAGGATGGTEAPTPSPQFRQALTTGQGQEAKFEGPLEEFLKKVETTSYTQPAGQAMQQPQQQVTQQPQATQVAQQQGPNYYSYGVFNEIDSILNPLQNIMPTMFAKEGGLAAPLMAKGGLNVVHHSGKPRLDFRQGAAVSGPGDGQSDDIPAMLADGEFVFPADVVAALGNGSTKAGSDKLYDMMHSIRSYHRSAKPQDLPPPAKKSPLDYLKKARR
jgi:hypothetical protein